MQKKNGYYSSKAETRKDTIKVYTGRSYVIDPHTQEAATFLGKGLGIVYIELPPALAGRRYTFMSDDDAGLGGLNHVDISPAGGIFSTDRIYDPDALAFMQIGYALRNGAALAQKIVLECHNDGDWSVKEIVGAWAQGGREFWVTVTANSIQQNRFIGSTGDPAVVVDLYVKNDKYIVANMAAQHTQGDDLAAMTIGTRTYPGRDAEVNWNYVRFPMGGTDEIIGRNVGEDLLLVDGLTDVLIGAAGMLSGSAVIATAAPILIAGLQGHDGSMSQVQGAGPFTFTVNVLNDKFNALLSQAAYYNAWITFTGALADLTITSVTLSQTDSRAAILTAGALAAGTGAIIINSAAFPGTILTSGVNQQIDVAITLP